MRRALAMVALVACAEPQTVATVVEPTETAAPIVTPTPEPSPSATPMVNPPVTGECPEAPPIVPLDVLLAGWGL